FTKNRPLSCRSTESFRHFSAAAESGIMRVALTPWRSLLPVPPVFWILHAPSFIAHPRWTERFRPLGHRSLPACVSRHGGQLCHRHRACATEPVGILSRAGD